VKSPSVLSYYASVTRHNKL